VAEIVISEFMHKSAVADLARDFAVLYEPTLGMDPPGLANVIRQARALLIRDRTLVDTRLIAQAGALRVVGQIGAHADNIDTRGCEVFGISVVRAPDEMADAIGEYVIAAAMTLTRGAFFATRAMMAGNWPREHLLGREVGGRTLALAGVDAGARSVAARAGALGMRVIGFDPRLPPNHPAWKTIAPVTFETLLAEADVLSVHLPPSPNFKGKLGTAALARLKPTAVLVVVSGGVVDEAAVANMLSVARLRGAAFDSFEIEPLTSEAGSVFAAVPNLILTPRIADLTVDSHLRSSKAIVAKVRGALNI
jgi:(S)-sulfolactate dehydrogenase